MEWETSDLWQLGGRYKDHRCRSKLLVYFMYIHRLRHTCIAYATTYNMNVQYRIIKTRSSDSNCVLPLESVFLRTTRKIALQRIDKLSRRFLNQMRNTKTTNCVCVCTVRYSNAVCHRWMCVVGAIARHAVNICIMQFVSYNYVIFVSTGAGADNMNTYIEYEITHEPLVDACEYTQMRMSKK